MTDRKGPKDRMDEIQLGLGGVFDALGEAFSEVTRRLEEGQAGEVRRSYEVDTGKGPLRAEAGIRVRFAGADVTPTSPSTSPVNTPKPAAPPEARSIDADILEDADGGWRLTADLPGVALDDLLLSQDGTQLKIETKGARHYRTEFDFPPGRRIEELNVHLNNGILDLSLPQSKA